MLIDKWVDVNDQKGNLQPHLAAREEHLVVVNLHLETTTDPRRVKKNTIWSLQDSRGVKTSKKLKKVCLMPCKSVPVPE